MKEFIYNLFGENNDLSFLQMASRALIMFVVTLIIIRISGMRSFGRKSAFDSIVVIMLGAILSRYVVGANKFLPIVSAGFALAIIHRTLAWISVDYDSLGRLIKGESICLFENGEIKMKNLRRSTISKKDIMEEVHAQLNEDTLEHVKEIFMERSGKISIIKK